MAKLLLVMQVQGMLGERNEALQFNRVDRDDQIGHDIFEISLKIPLRIHLFRYG